jgi:hypothetical protein
VPRLEGGGRPGGVGVGVCLFAPELASAALPYLVLAICPISMLLMLLAMQGSRDGGQWESPGIADGLTREERHARLREQQAAQADRIRALEQDEQPAVRDAVARQAHESCRGPRRGSRPGCRSKA